MKNMMTKLKTLAVAGMTMGLAFGFAPSAQAYDPPPDITPYISTDNEFETEYNPFALPNTMPHWMSDLVRHECWTSYQGGNRGFQSFWNCAGNWFMWTNHYYTVNMPLTGTEYYWNKVTQTYFPDNNFLGKDNTCLAYIQRAAEAKVGTSGKLTDDAEIGENITVALCQLLRPHEYGDPNDKAPHLWCCSNHLQYVDTEYRVVRTSNFASGLRIDGISWSRSNKIVRFDYYKYPKTAAIEPNVAPTELVNILYGHYSPGISNCIATLNRVSDDWTGTYLLHNRDYGRTEVKETVRYLAYNEETPKEPIETTTNRTRTVTHPDAWPALDEDVHLDRGDVLIMKSLCHVVDSAAQLLRAYELPGKKSGKWADPVCTNIVKVQENMHAIGYTYKTAWITNHCYHSGYSDRIERAIHDTYHMLPDLFASIDDDAALAGARTAYVNALACLLDADAFITGKAKSATGKTITGKRNLDQLHLIEFAESEEDGGEWNFAGWREFAEKTYASLTGKGTAAAVQTLDMADLGKKLDIHVGSRGDADHGVIDFSSLGPNRDGKITFDANAFFDGNITRDAVILDGSAITTNGPGHMVATRYTTARSGGGDQSVGQYPYHYVQRLHLTLTPATVDSTLNGLYPSGTLFSDLATMKAQYPADGESLRSGFAQMVDVATCTRKQLMAGDSINLVAGVYTAAPTDKAGGVFREYPNATLTGTDVNFENNEVSGSSQGYGGAIYASGTIAFTNATFRNNKAEMFGGAIDYHGEEKNGAKAILTNVTFADNTAQKGAALSCQGDNLSIDKATFTGNTTTLNGGAIIIMNNHKNIAIANASFSQNASGRHGGAIEIGTNAELTLSGDESGTSFEGNSAVNGGALYFEGGSKSVTFEDAVIFRGNTATEKGGAIYSCGMINMAGAVTLVTESDTIYNAGTLNWDLADGKAGCLNGYQNVTNDEGTLQITVDDAIAAPTNIVIATGNFSDIIAMNTRTFTITNALGGAAMTIRIDGGGVVGPTGGTVGYGLVTEAAGATTNLVLQVVTVKPRVVVTSKNSPYFITNCTYTAVKTDSDGGAAYVEDGGRLVVSNVTFRDNYANQGSAIYIEKGGIATFADVTFGHNAGFAGEGVYNSGLVNLDGRVTVETFFVEAAGDVGYFYTFGTLNWNLTDGKAGLFCNYQNLVNDCGTLLQITVEDYEDETNTFVIATGSFLEIKKMVTDTFTITNAANGAATTAKIDGGRVISGGSIYQLETVEDLSVPTTNLVLTVIQPDMSHVIVNSNLAGKYKPGEEIKIGEETYYYGANVLAEIPHGDLLVGTETLEIAGGSAAITNEVTLKAPAKLVIDNGAALSIMGEGSITNSLAAKDSISGNGAIYLDKGLTDDQLADYTSKLADGSNVLVARASVDDKTVKETAKVEEGGKTYYNVITSDQPRSEETDNTVVTSAIVVDGAGDSDGLLLKTNDEKPLVVAGSVTTTAPNQSLKLVKEQAADLTVHGKVTGFETISVENKNEAGKMTTTSTLTANKDITISNDGHLDAKALAGGDIYINNTSANTIIGRYDAQNIYFTNTAEGVAQDITLQAYGTDAKAGEIRLYGKDGCVYSNVVLVAGKNATPADLSANDGSGSIRFCGTNTLSGSVLIKTVDAFAEWGWGNPILRFENADVTSSPTICNDTEISGACNIASNDNGVATFTGALTLKDGAVLGGKTRLASSCANDNFVLEGTITLKDGAEVSRKEQFAIRSGATLKLQGSKIACYICLNDGTVTVESGVNAVNTDATFGFTNNGLLDLAGGEFVGRSLANFGTVNWNLAKGTTTLDWKKVYNMDSGSLMATVGDVASGTSYTLATNATAFAASLTVTNSVAGGAAATVKAGGVCMVAGQFWALDVKAGVLTLTALQAVQLTDVFLIDEEGKTNATAVVKFGDQTFEPEADGSFEVPANYPFDVVYQATDDYMFGPGWKEKTVSMPNGVSGDGPMPAELKQQVANQCQECWVDSDGEEGGREIALDTRERIVVADLNDIQPIAYSTNGWGAYPDANYVRIFTNSVDKGVLKGAFEDGYTEWLPQAGAYGKYDFVQKWSYLVVPGSSQPVDYGTTNATIYYSTYFPLTWATPEHGTLTVTNEGVAVASGDNVLGYSLLKLAATPVMTGTEHYEFTGWTVTTNSVAYTNIAEAAVTLEMPNAATELAGGFQWKSNYTEMVNLKKGETWQVFAGETYSNASSSALYANQGSHVFGEGARFVGSKISVGTGAGCYSYSGTFAFTNVTFSGNHAEGSGGAIALWSSTGALVRCVLAGNTAKKKGGAAYLSSGAALLLEDSTFDGNSATTSAGSGALYIWPQAVVSLRGVNTFKTATDTIGNEGTLAWDFTDHGEPLVETFASITNAGTLKIAFDTTLTNGVYTFLRLNGSSALEGTTDFTISNGSDEKVCEIGSEDWVYVGAKRFKIAYESGAYTLTVEPGIPMALDFAQPEGGTIAASTNDAAITSGTKVYPGEKVTLAFAPADHWQADTNTLQLVDATNKVYGLDYFADVTLSGANFKMTETNATFSMAFMISDAYRAELFEAATNSYLATSNAVENLRNNRLTGDETDRVLQNAASAFGTALGSLAAAYKPADGDTATNTLAGALDKIESDATAVSDNKPWTITVDANAVADGTNVFNTIDAAFAATDLLPYVTNLVVIGEQRAFTPVPKMMFGWNLIVRNWQSESTYDATKSPYQQTRLVFEASAQTDMLTNLLVSVKGEGRILLANDGRKKEAAAFEQALRDRVAAEPAAATVQVIATEHARFPEKANLDGECVVIDTLDILNCAITNWTAFAAPVVSQSEGYFAWNLVKDNHKTYLANYDDVAFDGSVEHRIQLDTDQTEGNVVTNYVIAGLANAANGKTFIVKNVQTVCELTVGGDTRYVGPKAYTLALVEDDENAGTSNLVFTVAWGIPHAVDLVSNPAEGGSVAASTNGVAFVSGTEILPSFEVTVVATTNLHWQFNGWTAATNGIAWPGAFDDETSATAKFTMPLTNVTVTAAFGIAETYRAELLAAIDGKYANATNAIEALRDNRLTGEETDGVLQNAASAFISATNALALATTPAGGEKAKSDVEPQFAEIVNDAQGVSDAKPYDLIVADDFEAIADEGSYDPTAGTFTVNGVAYQTNVNAFASFRAAYVMADTAFTTNVHVYGTQLIEDDVPNLYPWTLDLNDAILTIGIDGNNNLYASVTNKLAAIGGGSAIVFGKTEDGETRAVQDALAELIPEGSEIVIKAADVTPEKKGDDIEVKVDKTTKATGGATDIPALNAPTGDIAITVDADVTNDTRVAGKIEAPNGTVTIVNQPTNQALTVAGEVTAKNVVIDNYGHFEADVTAADLLIITNRSMNTIVGTYEGKTITITGFGSAVISNVTFKADSILLKGYNMLTGPLTLDAPAVTNANTFYWNVQNGNKTAHLNNLDMIVDKYPKSTNEYVVVCDRDQTLDEYVLADNAASAANRKLSVKLMDGGERFNYIADIKLGETWYPGDSRGYTLTINEANQLVLTVIHGKFAIDSKIVQPYMMAGNKIVVPNEGIVGTAIAVKATLAEHYQFNGWTGIYGDSAAKLDFADAAALETTFVMPVGEVEVTATFALSEAYRAEQLKAVSNAYAKARAEIVARDDLSPDEKAALVVELDESERMAKAAISAAKVPEAVAASVALAEKSISNAIDEADKTAEAIVRFETKALSVTEGEDVAVAVYGGSTNRSTAAKLSLVKNSFTKSVRAYIGGKRVTFPITLDWAKGDRTPITVVLKPAKSSKVDPDKFFTLQLGSEVATKMGELDICQVTVKDAEEPGGADYDYVRALAWPANGGTVSGAGYLKRESSKITLKAKANKWAEFAGWYYACTNDADKIDLARGPITEEKSMKVGNNGLVGEAGTYYAYFTNVLPVAAVNDPDISAEGAKGVWSEASGVFEGITGVKFSLPVSFDDGSDKGKLTVSYLPSGLKYNKSTGCIEGVPTKACQKSVRFVAKNAAGKHTVYYTFIIEVLPDEAIGTWNGVVRSLGEEGTHAGFGTVQFSATSAGKLSAKVTTRLTGTKSFSVKGYDYIDENTFGIAITNRSGEAFTATLFFTNDWKTAQLVGTVTGGKFEENEEEVKFTAIRSTCFDKKDKNQDALDFLAVYKGTYEDTLTVTNGDFVGSVTFQVKDGGRVQVKAKSVNGTYSATCAGAFRATLADCAAVQAAIRSGKKLWACDALLDAESGDVRGLACDYDADGDDTHEVIGAVK